MARSKVLKDEVFCSFLIILDQREKILQLNGEATSWRTKCLSWRSNYFNIKQTIQTLTNVSAVFFNVKPFHISTSRCINTVLVSFGLSSDIWRIFANLAH